MGGGASFLRLREGGGLGFEPHLDDPTLWLQVLREVSELMLLCKMRTVEDSMKFSMGSLAHSVVQRTLASFSHMSYCLLHLYHFLSNLPHTGEHKVAFPSLVTLLKPFTLLSPCSQRAGPGHWGHVV